MSNHSSEADPEMMSKFLKSMPEQQREDFQQFHEDGLKEFKESLGKTNRFPEGKLTEHDEGEIKFAIGVTEGKVVINFVTPVTWMGMLPDQAESLGRLLIKRAKKARKQL